MGSTVSDVLIAASGRTMAMSRGLLTGINPKDFARQPEFGGRLVDTNHPAFVYGHLALYPAKLLGIVGKGAGAVQCPQSFTDLFAAGVKCRHDPENAEHPPMAEIVERFENGYTRLIDAMGGVDDAVFAAPIRGNDRYREAFGTVGGAACFMMHDHPMFHLGQASAWRRMMGLGSVM